MKLFKKFHDDDSAATAIEYGLIAGLIAIGIVAAVTSIGTGISTQFSNVASGLP